MDQDVMLISKFAIDYVRNHNSNNTDWFPLIIFKAIGSVKTIIRRRMNLMPSSSIKPSVLDKNPLLYLSIPTLCNKLEYKFQILV